MMGEQRAKKVSEEDVLKEAEKSLQVLKEKTKEAAVVKPKVQEKPAIAKAQKEEKTQKKKISKPKIRSQKYQKAIALVDRSKFYNLEEAIDLVKKTSYAKFDASVEAHIKLIDKKDSATAGFRKLINLPKRVGKEPKIAILDEALIEKIQKEKKTDYDILLAKPEMMSKLAKIAKILGPQGKMPNPKSGTVTAEPEKTIAEFKAGKIELKTDKQGIVHQVIGKVSWEEQKIKANFEAVMIAVSAGKIAGITVCASMGPGIKVKI